MKLSSFDQLKNELSPHDLQLLTIALDGIANGFRRSARRLTDGETLFLSADQQQQIIKDLNLLGIFSNNAIDQVLVQIAIRDVMDGK